MNTFKEIFESEYKIPKRTFGLEQKISKFFNKKLEKEGLEANFALNYHNDGIMQASIDKIIIPYDENDDPIFEFNFKYKGETPSQVFKIFLDKLKDNNKTIQTLNIS